MLYLCCGMYGGVGFAHSSEFGALKIAGLGKIMGLPFRTPFSLHELAMESNQNPSFFDVFGWNPVTQGTIQPKLT